MPSKKGSKKKGKNLPADNEQEARSILRNTQHPTCIIAEEDIEESVVVGKGFYAIVKVGEWTRPDKKKEMVAIKIIKEDVVMGDMFTEANAMVKLEHTNIIKLFGICIVTRNGILEQVKLVTEYAKLGSLISVIRDENEDRRSFFCQITRLWQYAYQIAEGMQYLHSKNLIHFDLAARNVLLVTPNVVKICDFGLARAILRDQKILLEKEVPVAWCAPELFKYFPATKGCDVWSYGVLLWEMMSFGEKPWSNLTPLQIMIQADYRPYIRLPQPQACCNGLYGLMEACWSQELGDRPDFTQIIDSLKKVKPEVASANITTWTSRPKELGFEKESKITIIDRYGEEKYLGQNEGAQIGFVNQGCLNFDLIPKERSFETLKPKITGPFNMRHTNKKTISEEFNSTGKFPVNVHHLAELAGKNQEENVPAEPEQHLLQDPAGCYVPMTADQPNMEDQPPKNYSHPPPIPKRSDLPPNPAPSLNNKTLPKKIRAPILIPRKPRSLSTGDQRQLQDSQNSFQVFSSSASASNYPKDDMEEEHDPRFQSEDSPLIDFDKEVPHTQQEHDKSILSSLHKTVSHFPSLPNPPISEKENDVEVGILIDVENQEENQEDNPPPLPPKTRISRTKSGQNNSASLSNTAPISFPPLTYPSSHLNLSGSQGPVYSVPFPQILPKLPEIDRTQLNQPPPSTRDRVEHGTITSQKEPDSRPRPTSDILGESQTAYGDEINAGIEQIRLQLPTTSKDACYALILEVKGDIDHALKVVKVCSLTGITEKDAFVHLGKCGWNVEKTINYVFDKKYA